jgi:hypothetical protein
MATDIASRFRQAQNSLVIQASDLSLASITEMVQVGAIDLNPHYQRRERWDAHKQSKLIESFLLNVPVPPLYFAEEEFGRYSVIDGKQRVTAVNDFISGKLKLKGVESFPEINGLIFSELPAELQNALKVRPYLRVVTLLRQSDPSLKFEVFLRLNTGGDRLLPQEVRNVAFSGGFNDLLIELAANPFLNTKLKINSKKSPAYMAMADVEHVLRFFTTNSNWRNMGGSLAFAMDDFMRDNRSPDGLSLDRYRLVFNNTIRVCQEIWGDHAFERPQGRAGWRNQMISPLYDAQMVSVATLSFSEQAEAIRNRTEVILRTRDMFDDEEFVKSVTRATNNAGSIRKRISSFNSLFTEMLLA